MGFNFKNTETKETTGFSNQFITYGINFLKINNIEAKASKAGDKMQIKFHVEGPSMGKDFVGAELEDGSKAQGLVGKVNLGIYFNPDDQTKIDALMNNLMYIAEKAGVTDAVKAINADTLEDLLAKYAKLVSGKFMWFIVKAEEYNSDGKKGFALAFKEGKVGKDDNGKDIYQIFVKHADFSTVDKAVLVDNKIYKLKGVNVVGSNIGKVDTLEFNPTYDLKMLATADTEKDEVADMKDAF